MSLVSIIIPVFNTGKYLSQCFDSVLNQTYTDIEIIVVDDHSTDALTLELLKQYQEKYPNFTYITNEIKLGASGSRNRGIKLAKGEYFCFVDSDDYILPDYIETLFNALQNYKSSYVLCNYVDFDAEDPNETIINKNKCLIKANTIYKTRDLLENGDFLRLNVSPSARLLSRIDYINSKNQFQEGLIFEDTDWNVRLLANTETLVYLDYDGYRRRLRSTSVMHSTKDSKTNDIIFVCYNIFETLMQNNCFEKNRKNFFVFYMDSCLGRLDWFENKEAKDKFIQLYFEYSDKMGYKIDRISKANYIKFKLLYKFFKIIGNQEKKVAYKTRYIQQRYLINNIK